MVGQRTRTSLRRLVTLLAKLSESQAHGLTISSLKAELGVSQATAYRDLKELEDAGVELDRFDLDGTRRVRLTTPRRRPTLGLEARTRKALSLVQRGLTALEGTFVEQALDSLIRAEGKSTSAPLRKTGPSLAVIDELARALEKRQRVRFQYRGESDSSASERLVEPLDLHIVRDQLYLSAWDVERDALRTFKPARMTRVCVTPERCVKRELNLDARLAGSVRIWDGEPVDVAVRVTAAKARFVSEYPLHAVQTVSEQADGSVIVRANVNGLYEVSRWILNWGANAEALEPVGLRELVRRELEGALVPYGPEPIKESSMVSRGS
jgi:predicted DNA-binding transcriptional regulator YafY